jgi:hypothetical protein
MHKDFVPPRRTRQAVVNLQALIDAFDQEARMRQDRGVGGVFWSPRSAPHITIYARGLTSLTVSIMVMYARQKVNYPGRSGDCPYHSLSHPAVPGITARDGITSMLSLFDKRGFRDHACIAMFDKQQRTTHVYIERVSYLGVDPLECSKEHPRTKPQNLLAMALWRANPTNAERKRKNWADYAKSNAPAIAAKRASRRAAERGSRGSITDLEWSAIVRIQHGRCALWGQPGWDCPSGGRRILLEKDHFHTPVAKGGCSYAFNFRGLCKPCNLKKRDHIISPFISLFDRQSTER